MVTDVPNTSNMGLNNHFGYSGSDGLNIRSSSLNVLSLLDGGSDFGLAALLSIDIEVRSFCKTSSHFVTTSSLSLFPAKIRCSNFSSSIYG